MLPFNLSLSPEFWEDYCSLGNFFQRLVIFFKYQSTAFMSQEVFVGIILVTVPVILLMIVIRYWWGKRDNILKAALIIFVIHLFIFLSTSAVMRVEGQCLEVSNHINYNYIVIVVLWLLWFVFDILLSFYILRRLLSLSWERSLLCVLILYVFKNLTQGILGLSISLFISISK